MRWPRSPTTPGYVTALAVGWMNLEAMVGGLTTTPWRATLSPAVAAVAEAAPAAAIEDKAAASIQSLCCC